MGAVKTSVVVGLVPLQLILFPPLPWGSSNLLSNGYREILTRE